MRRGARKTNCAMNVEIRTSRLYARYRTRKRSLMSALTSSDLLDLFGSKPTEIEEEATRFKEMRDQWNEKVKQRIAERNGFNLQVQELITEVQNKKAIRDEANQKVKDLKMIRAERTEIAREKRAALKATKEKWRVQSLRTPRKGRRRGRLKIRPK